MRVPVLALALLALLAAGCEPGLDAGDVAAGPAARLSAEDAARVLDLVNDPATDLALLDGAIGLDNRAARSIAAFRAGPDGVVPSADDGYLDSIAALDALFYVSDSAIAKLGAYALAHPAARGEVVEDVSFRGWEAEAVVWGVNHDSPAALDAVVDSRAAAGLVAARPFATVAAMGPVAYVGAATLVRLRAYAPVWWTAQRAGGTPLAGTFDGITFDEPTAVLALWIANDATASELAEHGVAAAPAARILESRPYASLAAVAALSGVGTTTMAALKAYAQSGAWPPVDDCITQLTDAVFPRLDALLFMSESDRPLDVVSYPGAGATAPTAASFMALMVTAPGTTAEQRDVARFYQALEPASATADPGAAAAVQAAVAAQLTDVIYVAIQPPPGDPNHCVLQVYLVGRTACGDIVALHSEAVET